MDTHNFTFTVPCSIGWLKSILANHVIKYLYLVITPHLPSYFFLSHINKITIFKFKKYFTSES